MAVLPREFCNFTPDFCGLAPMCTVGRVRRSQQKTVHAEPCEAMPLQQGGHWVGKNRSRDILKRRLQASCLWHPRISQIRTILSEQGNDRCPRDVFIRIPLPITYYYYVYKIGVRDYYIHIGVGYQRCSFNNIGQCESLWMWDGQQNGSHVFLLCRIACGRMCPVREHWLMIAQHKSNGCHTD